MAVQVIMPKWGLTMESGTVATWYKTEGQRITQGEPLAQVETDKILNTLESPADGVVTRILVPAKSEVPVGTVLCLIE